VTGTVPYLGVEDRTEFNCDSFDVFWDPGRRL